MHSILTVSAYYLPRCVQFLSLSVRQIDSVLIATLNLFKEATFCPRSDITLTLKHLKLSLCFALSSPHEYLIKTAQQFNPDPQLPTIGATVMNFNSQGCAWILHELQTSASSLRPSAEWKVLLKANNARAFALGGRQMRFLFSTISRPVDASSSVKMWFLYENSKNVCFS